MREKISKTSLHDVELVLNQGRVKAQERAAANYAVMRDAVFGGGREKVLPN